MDNAYLEELITEAQNREGGLLLNIDDKPAAVVLTVEKYNQLVGNTVERMSETVDQLVSESVTELITGLASPSNIQETYESLIAASVMEENLPPVPKGKKILVTGGAGYIGSHAVRELIAHGYEVVVFDNLSTGNRKNVPEQALLIEGDLNDTALLGDVFAIGNFYAVMHFAASIQVEESVREPQKYLENNVINTVHLLTAMTQAGVHRIIFSSTAAVYGQQSIMPIAESARLQPENPYGYTKLLCERLIKYYSNYSGLQAIVFRYFNACGCGYDGLVVNPHATHLIPHVIAVAQGRQESIRVFGTDYPTFDGTCIRDYVHVQDIARAHVAALEHIEHQETYRVYNIGTGKGSSVREVISKASEVIGKIITMEMAPRRPGDSMETVADNTKIRQELDFETKFSDLETIIASSWKQAREAEMQSARF